MFAAVAVGTLIEQPENNNGTTKTSRAEITLKSATLPRRKPAKTEIKLDIQSRVSNRSHKNHTVEYVANYCVLRSG